MGQARWQNPAGADLLAPAFDRQRFFFDDQGIAIESEEPGMDLAYVAELRVPVRDVALPGAAAEEDETFDPYLRRVTVKVTHVANQKFDFDHASSAAYRSHTTLIARAGK